MIACTRHTSVRQRRRKLVTQLLALFGLGIGSVATAADGGYYAPASPYSGRATTVECCPPQPICPPGMNYPGTTYGPSMQDGSVLSESNQRATDSEGDDFLSDGDTANGSTAPSPNLMADVDAIVNGAGTATPLAFTGGRSGGLDAPNMIGDYHGYTYTAGLIQAAGVGRRFKITENVSPIPQDRVFFNYNHFHNALVDIDGNEDSMDLFTFGFEKTFLNGLGSLEVRLPFASTLDSTQRVGADNFGTELGSLQFALKMNLLSGDNWMLSGGSTLTLPTGDDFRLVDTGVVDEVENDTVFIGPFLGYVVQPNRNWFAQAFVQTDFATGGSSYRTTPGGFQGTTQEQHLLFLSTSVGRWLHRSNDRRAIISGVAAMAEVHYTTTMNDVDPLWQTAMGYDDNRFDLLNFTGALNFAIGQSSLRVGGGAPLRQGSDKAYDAEFLVQFNRFF